jgi:hypothetical protein
LVWPNPSGRLKGCDIASTSVLGQYAWGPGWGIAEGYPIWRTDRSDPCPYTPPPLWDPTPHSLPTKPPRRAVLPSRDSGARVCISSSHETEHRWFPRRSQPWHRCYPYISGPFYHWSHPGSHPAVSILSTSPLSNHITTGALDRSVEGVTTDRGFWRGGGEGGWEWSFWQKSWIGQFQIFFHRKGPSRTPTPWRSPCSYTFGMDPPIL